MFKKKIEMDEDAGRLGPNNQLIEGSDMPLHFMSRQRDLRLPSADDSDSGSSSSEGDAGASVRSRIPSLAFRTESVASRDREQPTGARKPTPNWRKGQQDGKRASSTRFATADQPARGTTRSVEPVKEWVSSINRRRLEHKWGKE